LCEYLHLKSTLQKVKVFAGIHRSRNGKVTPTGVGRICNWTPDQKGPTADEYPSFGAYQRSLTLKCDEGEPGIITWTPDENTPDTVYYQCFTHRYLGWKINVVDECDGQQPQASDREEVFIDVEAEPSIKHESKLFPSENFLQQHEKDLIKHHNMNGAPPKVTADLQKNGEFNKLITQGIRAAEALEESILREQKQNGTKSKAPITTIQVESQEDDKELLEAIAKIPPNNQRQPQRPLLKVRPQFTSSGMPIFLRPPQGVNFPFYQQVKLAPRRPIAMERRPVSRKPVSPYLLPQQSIMVNHYKKPSFGPPPMGHMVQQQQMGPPQYSGHTGHMGPPQTQTGHMGQHQQLGPHQMGPPPMRHYLKSKIPPPPPKQMTPVLLLGEPTEIKPSYKKPTSDLVIGKPSKTQIEISPAYKKKVQEPIMSRPQKFYHQKKMEKVQVQPPRSPFKDPFDIKTESPIVLREASNTGFKADTVIVESGFRPIFRREDVVKIESFEDSGEGISGNNPSISRRSDNFEDSDELEGLLTNEETQSTFFEPMFIPSPRDSVALPLVNDTNDSKEQVDIMVADASDKQEFFYLPPNDSKRSTVTYDAKAVLDTSLLNDPHPSKNDVVKLSSKTKQFIKDTPQFAPFTGEIPSDLMLQLSASRAASSSSVLKGKSSTISTKLSAVKTNDATRRKRDTEQILLK
jgi:hypothetical protein